MFYVRIDGISDEDLEFFGYVLVEENDNFKFYRDYRLEEYVVHKANPHLFVDDVNDAVALANRSGHPSVVTAPPNS